MDHRVTLAKRVAPLIRHTSMKITSLFSLTQAMKSKLARLWVPEVDKALKANEDSSVSKVRSVPEEKREIEVISDHGENVVRRAKKGMLVLEESPEKKAKKATRETKGTLANKDQWDLKEIREIEAKEVLEVKKVSKGTLVLRVLRDETGQK